MCGSAAFKSNHLLPLEMACFQKCQPDETKITIPSHIDQNGITYYDIHINVGSIMWTIQRRYREFVDLNDKLVSEHRVSRDLLPPKKVNLLFIYFVLSKICTN